MNRKKDRLIELEAKVLEAALDLLRQGQQEFHGFALADHLRLASGSRVVGAYSTLYRALSRLEGMGFLQSRWEDPEVAIAEGRPRRRLYRVVGDPASALAQYVLSDARKKPTLRVAPA